jgi:hypothetical protein
VVVLEAVAIGALKAVTRLAAATSAMSAGGRALPNRE